MCDKISTLINSDLYRIAGNTSLQKKCYMYFFQPGFKYMFWHRIAHAGRMKGRMFYLIPRFMLRHYSYKFGFDIPAETTIGAGFYIGHFGGIVVSSKARIGRNCNISQGVTIGYAARGESEGYPTIEDNVYIGPGAVNR